jgi:hypothetical protein
MSYAPDGRKLSPGETIEEVAIDNHWEKKEAWREDLTVIEICPDCREMPPNLVETSEKDTRWTVIRARTFAALAPRNSIPTFEVRESVYGNTTSSILPRVLGRYTISTSDRL